MARKAPLFLGAALLTAGLGSAEAQTKQAEHLPPQSMIVSQQETMSQLKALSHRKGPVGPAARKVLALYEKHAAREREFIMPPLTLLPYIADGGVTPDMAWALPMLDRVKAERAEILQEHENLTDALNALAVAGTKAHDPAARAFAESAAADTLNDMEIAEPTLLILGDMLHAKLSTNR